MLETNKNVHTSKKKMRARADRTKSPSKVIKEKLGVCLSFHNLTKGMLIKSDRKIHQE